MIEQSLARLEQLAQADATLAPLARLQGAALRASTDRIWDESVPPLDRRQLEAGTPLLHGQSLRADADRVCRSLLILARLAGHSDAAVATEQAIKGDRLGCEALLEAVIVQDGEALLRLADDAGADPLLLAMLGQLAALPLLFACGRSAAPLLAAGHWQAGLCPVCAAWPTLAELRGLERTRWLRCGRCGSGWSFAQGACPFCLTSDRRTRGYLAPEQAREAQRAVTCDACQGYLKTVTTIGPIAPAELGLMDARTVELDVAALDHGYARPDTPGYALAVSVSLSERRSPWRLWRR